MSIGIILRDCLATGAALGAILTGLVLTFVTLGIYEAILGLIGVSIIDVLIWRGAPVHIWLHHFMSRRV